MEEMYECGKWIKTKGVKDNSKKYCKGCATKRINAKKLQYWNERAK